jgi:HEAT repeat protein
LQQRPDDRAVPALVAALSDDDSLVVRLAANALAATGSAAVPELIKLVEDSPSKIRLEATRALALSGDTRSIPALFNALDSDSTLMEYWANEGLDRLGVGMTFFKP